MSDDGRVSLDKHEVRHLREALDNGSGRVGLGSWFVCAMPGLPKHCYALMVRRDKIRTDPSFKDVRLTNCVPKEIIDALLAFATDD